MSYLYKEDRKHLASKLAEAVYLNPEQKENLEFEFEKLDGLEISNVEREDILKWCRSNSYEAKKIIIDNLSDPAGTITKLKALI